MNGTVWLCSRHGNNMAAFSLYAARWPQGVAIVILYCLLVPRCIVLFYLAANFWCSALRPLQHWLDVLWKSSQVNGLKNEAWFSQRWTAIVTSSSRKSCLWHFEPDLQTRIVFSYLSHDKSIVVEGCSVDLKIKMSHEISKTVTSPQMIDNHCAFWRYMFPQIYWCRPAMKCLKKLQCMFQS